MASTDLLSLIVNYLIQPEKIVVMKVCAGFDQVPDNVHIVLSWTGAGDEPHLGQMAKEWIPLGELIEVETGACRHGGWDAITEIFAQARKRWNSLLVDNKESMFSHLLKAIEEWDSDLRHEGPHKSLAQDMLSRRKVWQELHKLYVLFSSLSSATHSATKDNKGADYVLSFLEDHFKQVVQISFVNQEREEEFTWTKKDGKQVAPFLSLERWHHLRGSDYRLFITSLIKDQSNIDRTDYDNFF